jgi:uncharacterized protein YigE (DUF2233 family)
MLYPLTSHQSWILSRMRITGRDVCYCSFTPILHHIRYFELKNQDFPYGTFVNVNNNIREN